MPAQVCKIDDDFVRDNLRWVVRLNNGEVIYEDDGRPGVAPHQAWIRLKTYCTEEKLYIVQMWLQFRSHVVEVQPANASGYFLVKQAFGVWGDTESFNAYIAGAVLPDGKIHAIRWKTPELEPLEEQVREADPKSPTLIVRPD